MAKDDFSEVFFDLKRQNEESMARITTHTENINRRIRRILSAL